MLPNQLFKKPYFNDFEVFVPISLYENRLKTTAQLNYLSPDLHEKNDDRNCSRKAPIFYCTSGFLNIL